MMKKEIADKIKRYIWCFEGKIALLSSLLLLIIAVFFDAYGSFNTCTDQISSFIISIIGGWIALLGLVLSGVAILGGVIDKKYAIKIKYVTEDEKSIDKLFNSFNRLCIFILISTVELIIYFIMIHSKVAIAPKKVFYCLFFLLDFTVIYIVAYVISVIRNTITIILLRIEDGDNSISEKVTDAKINWIIEMMLNMDINADKMNNNEKKCYLIEVFSEYLQQLPIDEEERKSIIDYCKKQYNIR